MTPTNFLLLLFAAIRIAGRGSGCGRGDFRWPTMLDTRSRVRSRLLTSHSARTTFVGPPVCGQTGKTLLSRKQASQPPGHSRITGSVSRRPCYETALSGLLFTLLARTARKKRKKESRILFSSAPGMKVTGQLWNAFEPNEEGFSSSNMGPRWQ